MCSSYRRSRATTEAGTNAFHPRNEVTSAPPPNNALLLKSWNKPTPGDCRGSSSRALLQSIICAPGKPCRLHRNVLCRKWSAHAVSTVGCDGKSGISADLSTNITKSGLWGSRIVALPLEMINHRRCTKSSRGRRCTRERALSRSPYSLSWHESGRRIASEK